MTVYEGTATLKAGEKALEIDAQLHGGATPAGTIEWRGLIKVGRSDIADLAELARAYGLLIELPDGRQAGIRQTDLYSHYAQMFVRGVGPAPFDMD